MKKFIISLPLIFMGSAVFGITWIITNSEFTFSPATTTINTGDDVNFSLESFHNAVEVSKATWDVNGNTPLAGGFQVTFGGGLVAASKLTVGTHYYVCAPHASLGMKGIIIVQSTTGISENISANLTVYPNPSVDQIRIKAGDTMIGALYFITDQSGRRISDGRLNDETTQVDISRLAHGIYILQVEGQRGQNIKFIKN
jgi:plastocyanin